MTTLRQVSKPALLIYQYYIPRVDEDYHPGPYTTIIPAGETSASFIVNVIDDNVFENTEDFSLTFRDSLPLNVIGANRATVTIMDDDGGKYV